jgi:2-C-methyl-D-erythritol 2,4-cyclodiphosphate synthase
MARGDRSFDPSQRPRGGADLSDLRIGLGVDAHRFAEGIPLVLAGVDFPGEPGLAGHSDGDVIAHALIDAVLGAAGLGDIGSLFPSGDARWHGADSLHLLRDAYLGVREAGFALVNADCVLVGEEPRISEHRQEMRHRLAGAMGVEPDRVNVRATTTDRLGFTGRGDGLAAEAVALLERR